MDRGGVSWGYDGYIYYHARLEGNGLARIPETGGQPEVASRPDTSRGEGAHNAPSALPNGRGVLMRVQTDTSKGNTLAIAVLDTRSGTHRVLVRGRCRIGPGRGGAELSRREPELHGPGDQEQRLEEGAAQTSQRGEHCCESR